jgi:uncharacterized protein (DUF305 family)
MHQTLTTKRSLVRLRRAGRNRWRWLALALGIVLVGLVVVSQIASSMPGEGSLEVRFARNMVAHHEQAVQMALILRNRSTDEELRTFALDILLTQQAQVGQMQGWLAVWNQPLAGPEPPMAGMGEMMGMATTHQIDELRSLSVPEAEVAFLQLMIRHHQGGVAMAQEVVGQTRRPEVVQLATAIVEGQQSEITYMLELLTERGAAAPPPLELTPEQHGMHP